jgi:hypothetical protein
MPRRSTARNASTFSDSETRTPFRRRTLANSTSRWCIRKKNKLVEMIFDVGGGRRPFEGAAFREVSLKFLMRFADVGLVLH